MKPGKGGEKGHQYEREIAVKLSLWLTGGEKKDVLYRSEASGARFTAKGIGSAGDITARHVLGHRLINKFVIECKFWRSLEIHCFLGERGELYKALIKVQGEALKEGKKWMLIVKQNYQPDFIFFPRHGVISTIPFSFHGLFEETVAMCELETFLGEVTPEELLGDGIKNREECKTTAL